MTSTNIQPYKAAIAAELTNGDFEAATNRALSLYPSKRAALERAYLTKDVDLFREICGLDVEFERPLLYQPTPAPVQYQTPTNYAPLVKGAAVLGGLIIFGALVLKICDVILTGVMVGLSAAVATVTEYAAYIGGIIIAVYALGAWLSGRNEQETKTNAADGINVVVNIHSPHNNGTQSAK